MLIERDNDITYTTTNFKFHAHVNIVNGEADKSRQYKQIHALLAQTDREREKERRTECVKPGPIIIKSTKMWCLSVKTMGKKLQRERAQREIKI